MSNVSNTTKVTDHHSNSGVKKTQSRKSNKKKESTEPAPKRRSTRTVARLNKPANDTTASVNETNAAPPHNTLQSGPAYPENPMDNHTAAPPFPSIQSADDSAAQAQETTEDETDMKKYMGALRVPIYALETRELMRAAIAAPFWWSDLASDLQKQVIKLHPAILAGQFKDHEEVLQLPIEHVYMSSGQKK